MVLLKLTLFLLVAIVSRSELLDSSVDRSVFYNEENINYKNNKDLTANVVIEDVEKYLAMKKEKDIYDAIDPLPAQDVKCLMSADTYCSTDMKIMKEVLIQALRHDCENCSVDQKEKAGRVIATMLIHDPVAWKMFLTRYDGLKKFK